MRKRECLACKERFTTFERQELPADKRLGPASLTLIYNKLTDQLAALRALIEDSKR